VVRLSIYLLGPFLVTRDGEVAAGFEYDKVRALLAYLAAEADRPHRREELAGLFWPDQPERTARNSLRQALSKLRQAIGDGDADPPFLHISREAIQFNRASNYELDVEVFKRLLAARDAHRHRELRSCAICAQGQQEAVGRYRGEFMAGLSLVDSAPFEAWAVVKREECHHLALKALSNLAVYQERLGNYDQAYRYAVRQIGMEPWREEAHRQSMRALAFDGQRSAALAQYESCREILAAELGVPPATETTDLYERIRSGTLDDRPADRRITGTVPVATTSLIGREKALTELKHLLLDPDCRLLTVTGLGGMGKTRLAQEMTRRLEAEFPNGAAFVPLAAVSSAQGLVSAVVDALGLRLQGSRPEQVQLFNFLGDKGLLLTLDNFEQLLSGLEVLIELMQQAPKLALLVTSRQRLNLQAEWVFDLGGLDYPAEAKPESLEGYTAVQLFNERARQVERGFSMTAGDAEAVARICRLCEGMPLAIELAAATVRYRSCADIAGQLASNLQALTADYGDIPERHQSIHAAFEHSWALLTDRERALFSRLSVFQGGFDEAAAAEVTQVSGAELKSLIDKSLVQRMGGGRFGLHPLIKQYAAEKLRQLGLYEATLDRHGAYFLHLAGEAQPHLEEQDQSLLLDRLDSERDNLRAMLRWAKSSQRVEQGARVAEGLCLFWFMRGYLTEGREQLLSFLALVDEDSAPALRARLLDRAGFLARYQGDFDNAYALISEGLSISRRLGDDHATADALANLGYVVLHRNDFSQARLLYDEALAINQALNNGQGIADSLSHLALISFFEGDYQAAQREAGESLAIWRKLGDKQAIAWALSVLGKVVFHQGDLVKAEQCFREGLIVAREIGFMWVISLHVEGMARVATANGQIEQAVRLAGGAAAMRRVSGIPLSGVESAELEKVLAPAFAALSEETAAAAWDEGQKMTLRVLVRCALDEAADPQ
jgi:predicted ATPase/DNA-binding SARP family transcriptional activator